MRTKILSSLLGVLAIAGCTSHSEPSAPDAPAVSIPAYLGVRTVNAADQLPPCTPGLRSSVVYLESAGSLLYCDGSQYRTLSAVGKPGADGISWVVVTMDAGSSCGYGGTIVVAGPDADRDGRIDTVLSSQAVCDGAPGEKGDRGETGAAGLAGASGGDGLDGNSVAIRLIPFAANSACPAGGVRIESGVDVSHDGVLGDAEVSSTAELCNGASGSADASAPPPSTDAGTATADTSPPVATVEPQSTLPPAPTVEPQSTLPPGPPEAIWFSQAPTTALVGAAATFVVAADRPAPAGGTCIQLSSAMFLAAQFPPTACIVEGATTVAFDVVGIAPGPFVLLARTASTVSSLIVVTFAESR